MIHSFAETAWTALYAADQKSYVRPTPVLSHLGQIAKSFRRGRQEDAHEFLRYTIDAFQRAALFGTDPCVLIQLSRLYHYNNRVSQSRSVGNFLTA